MLIFSLARAAHINPDLSLGIQTTITVHRFFTPNTFAFGMLCGDTSGTFC